jgi:hypothetical protein
MKGLAIEVVRDDLEPFECDCCGSSERWVVLLGEKIHYLDGTTRLRHGALLIGHGPDKLRALLDASATLKYLIEEVGT